MENFEQPLNYAINQDEPSADYDADIDYEPQYRANSTYIPGDRFQNYNRYTGQRQGQRQYINTSSIYQRNVPQQPGALEFSLYAEPAPQPEFYSFYQAPLAHTASNPQSPNPYIQQKFTQQRKEMTHHFNNLSQKIDNLSKELQYQSLQSKALMSYQLHQLVQKQPTPPSHSKYSTTTIIFSTITILIACCLILMGILLLTGTIHIF